MGVENLDASSYNSSLSRSHHANFTAPGHINPMMQFSKRLASKGLHVTIVIFSSKVTKHTRRLGSVEVVTVDFVSYEGKLSSDDYSKQFRAAVTRKLPELVAELNNSSGHPISCLLYDSHLPWLLDTARQLGLAGASLFTQSCAVDNVYYNVHEMQLKIPPEELLVTVSRLPALSPLEITDLPSFVQGMDSESEYSFLLNHVVGQFSNFREADWIFVNTFSTLEEEAVNWLASQRSIKPIGPLIPSFYLDRQLEDDKEESESKKLPSNFVEESSEKGLIVTWSPQLEVLAHESVGCFMTHCGWNSTLEALSLGVPMVAMPHWTDQPTNAKCIADVWHVGVRVKENEKGIVTKEEVEGCIREVMEGERGNEMRRNSDKWMKLAKTAVDEGGSSDKNITEFAAQLARKFHETKDSKV
ncbi:hypothetical protein D5086_029589 [Populus alba]|uniref:Uncharacterized protein n=1 Tax=Populus alba TaxID=43335 RepID=A0ACC4ATY5_POPAL